MHAPGDDLKNFLVVKSAVPPSPVSQTITLRQLEHHQPIISSSEAASQNMTQHYIMENRKRAAVPILEPDTVRPQYEVLGDPGSQNSVSKLSDFIANSNMKPSGTRADLQKASKKEKTTTLLQPVAVGARTSKFTILLHEECQRLGIPLPVFTFGGDGLLGWTVEVGFPGLELVEMQGIRGENGRQYASKQEAKEALCEKTYKTLVNLEAEGKPGLRDRRKRSVAAGGGVSVGAVAQEQQATQEPAINYVGQILEFQRSIAAPQPFYTDYQSGNLFACLLTIEGHPAPFGNLTSLHRTKKIARQDAARCAVEHLQAQGVWPSDIAAVGGIKKKIKANAPQLTQLDNSPRLPSTSSSSPLPNNASYAQQVVQLATRLSLPTPEYRFSNPNIASIPSDAPIPAAAKDFHTVSIYFRNSGPHSGPWGTVRNVYGKKKAREECARLTLEYLKRLEKHRMEKAAGLVDTIMSGEDLRRAAERKANGEVFREVVMEDDDESDNEFIDAAEGH